MTDVEFDRILDSVAGDRDVNAKQAPDPRFTEKREGKTVNGGDYSIAYYYDNDGRPCVKAKAKKVNIVEYLNDGSRVNECYGVLK